MSREIDGESTQRTVAELLAQYGAADGPPTRRRRRKLDDADNDDAAPQTIINRVLGADPPLPSEQPPTQQPVRRPGTIPSQPPPPLLSRPAIPVPQPTVDQAPTGVIRPAVNQPPVNVPQVDPNADTAPQPIITGDYPSARMPVPPRPPVSPEPVTEEFGKIVDEPLPGESTQAHPGPLIDDDYLDDREYARQPGRGERLPAQEDTQAHLGLYHENDDYPEYELDAPGVEPLGLEDDASDLADETGHDSEQEQSPTQQWLIMALQLGIGLVGGAGVWLAFQWFWQALPAAALAGAIVVTVGLVLLVRKVRGSDDVQTMMLAVLVGLIATVSPVAFLLIGH